jgi:three-Cys-motif partner protein
MPKDNSDFFKEKKIWSEVKDELLGCYLLPYFSKILFTGNPVLYIDCFAGKGKFDDGNPGSPLVALDNLERSVTLHRSASKNRNTMPQVNMKFIELNHAADLSANLTVPPQIKCEIISGKFEDNIFPLLKNEAAKHKNLNVFLYIDPYGIKVLNAEMFDALPDIFSTVELLINFNSFGFIREACRTRKIAFRENQNDVFSDLEEYDSSIMDSVDELNDVAGGDYWQPIIDRYNEKNIDCYQAEKEFANKYKLRLRQKYKYVLDMPIRLKPRQQPKYRMVYATNYPDGCIIMADNIAKRTDRLFVDIQNFGQMSLFEQTVENEVIDGSVLESNVKQLLSTANGYVRLNKFLADFYNEFGVLCDSSRLSSGKNSVLRTFEDNNAIDVIREPKTTPTGKTSTFWSEKPSEGKTISIKIK